MSEEQPLGAPPTHAAHPAQEPFTFGNSGRNVAGHIFCFVDFCSFACSKLDDQLWKLWEIFLAMTLGRQNLCSLSLPSLPRLSALLPFRQCFFLSFSPFIFLCLCASLRYYLLHAFLPSFLHITEHRSPFLKIQSKHQPRDFLGILTYLSPFLDLRT